MKNKESKWTRFHRMLRRLEGALIRLAAFLILLIFLGQTVWAHIQAAQTNRINETHLSQTVKDGPEK